MAPEPPGALNPAAHVEAADLLARLRREASPAERGLLDLLAEDPAAPASELAERLGVKANYLYVLRARLKDRARRLASL
jgi:transposase-like protein